MEIPNNLQISVFHEGVLLLLGYSNQEEVLSKLSQLKSDNRLVELITTKSDSDLYDLFQIKDLSIGKTENWAIFLKELQNICQKYGEYHPIVLGSVIELMDQLDWQDTFNYRKFLTLFLHSKEEMAHLKLAISGTNYLYLENWRETIIGEAQGYASYKSKLA